MLTLILAVALAMGISFLCSVMEAAILSLNPGRLALLSKKRPRVGKICAAFKQDIEKPIAVILILNTTAHTFGAAIAGAQFDKLFGSDYIWLFSLGFTALMVQYTEILPKTLGVRFNVGVMSATAGLLKSAVRMLNPLIHLVHWINRPFEWRGASEAAKTETLNELEALAAVAQQESQITPMQEQAICRIPDWKVVTVESIMRAPEQIVFLQWEMSRECVLQIMREYPHSRYPVRQGRGGAIVGVLTVRKMLEENIDWHSNIRPATVVKRSYSLLQVAEQYSRLDSKLILVEDESGRRIGMFTTNDLLKHLFAPASPDADGTCASVA